MKSSKSAAIRPARRIISCSSGFLMVTFMRCDGRGWNASANYTQVCIKDLAGPGRCDIKRALFQGVRCNPATDGFQTSCLELGNLLNFQSSHVSTLAAGCPATSKGEGL